MIIKKKNPNLTIRYDNETEFMMTNTTPNPSCLY